MVTIFGFIKIGETGYSEIDFIADNSGAQETPVSTLGDAIFLELEMTKGAHYVLRVDGAIRVMGHIPLQEFKLQLNKAFMKVYNIVPSYFFERVDV